MDIRTDALWLYLLLVGPLLGGALFERLVLVPIWSADLPHSVRTWNPNPALAIDQRRFFAVVSPALMLLGPANVYFAATASGPGRWWLLVSACALTLVMVATIAYFAPTLHRLTIRRGEGMSDDALIRTARQWVALQWVRLLFVAVAFVTALEAFRLSALG